MNNSSLAVTVNITSPAAASSDWVPYFFSGFSFCGLIMNSLVFIFILRPNVIPGKVPRAFLLNQVIGEWFSCLLRSFSWLTDAPWPVPDNELGTFFCKLMYYSGIYVSTLLVSYSNVVLLVVERYVSVVHPSHHKKFTPAVIATAILLTWGSGPVRVIYRFVDPARIGTKCILIPHDWRILAPIVIIWGVILPLITVAVLNARIIYVMKSHSASLNSSGGNALRKKLQRDLTLSVLTTCLAMAITVGPAAVVYLLMNFGAMKNDLRGPLYLNLTHLSSTFFVINPLAYMFLMRAIRRQAVALFSCQAIREKMGRASQSGREVATVSNSTKKTGATATSNEG